MTHILNMHISSFMHISFWFHFIMILNDKIVNCIYIWLSDSYFTDVFLPLGPVT